MRIANYIRQRLFRFWNLVLRKSPLLMFVFLLLWIRSCREAAVTEEKYTNNLGAKENALSSYKLANGQLVYEKGLLQVTNQELKKQVWMKNDSLKLLLEKLDQPVVGVISEVRYLYDSLHIPFYAPVAQDFQRSFRKDEQWFSLSGSVNREGLFINRISIPNTQRLVVGYKRGRPIVTVTNSNPYLIMDKIEGQLLHIPKKQWVLGAGGTWNLYEPPSIGLFLGYKLLEF